MQSLVILNLGLYLEQETILLFMTVATLMHAATVRVFPPHMMESKNTKKIRKHTLHFVELHQDFHS